MTEPVKAALEAVAKAGQQWTQHVDVCPVEVGVCTKCNQLEEDLATATATAVEAIHEYRYGDDE